MSLADADAARGVTANPPNRQGRRTGAHAVRSRPGRRFIALLAECVLVLAAFVGVSDVAQAATGAGPALLEADALDAGHVELAWTAVADATQYTAYRDGSVLSVANTLRAVDTSVAPGTTHTYTVTATVGGSETGASPAQTVTVPAVADTQAPTQPGNFHATTVGNTSATLTWQASTDDVGVIGYFVKVNSILYAYTEGSLTTNVPYLKASTTYTFTLTAMDASGKESTPAQLTITTTPLGTADTVAPGAPTLTATPYSASEVDLSWSKPTDSDLTGFLVFQGSQLLEDVPPNSSAQTRVLPVTGLSAQTSYTFSVRSYDAAGNQSTVATKTVTTLAATDTQVTRGPYVQRVDDNSARVVWRTNIAAPSKLSYSDGTTTTTVVDAAPRTDHSVLIGPLPSLSRITYTLNYPTPVSGNFETCSSSPATLHLDAVGDMGGGSTPEKDIANLVASDHPDLIAAMGDDVYPTGLDKDYPARLFVPYATAMRGSAYFTTFGNHEYYSPGAADAHRAYSQPGNESYFSFDCSGVHFTVLDAYQPYKPGSTQYQWLASDLAATTQPWKVVVLHIPPYSSSTTGPYPGSTGVLNPLFEQYHVQLVLAGHSHNYERTNVLNGVTYMVDGGGGNGINSFSGSQPSWSAYRAAEYSYVRFTISPSLLSGTEVRQDGSTGDTFSIAGSGTTGVDTVIDSGPAAQTKATTVSFAFHATQTPATFQCTLDGGAATSCVSPMTYSGLTEGTHHFSVQATSTSTDPTPATATWTVDTTAPSSPTGLTATAPTSAAVNLNWNASTDANGIAGYDIIRNGSPLTSISGSATGYSDASVTPGSTYSYQVDARDPAGNVSGPSAIASVTVPNTAPPVFADGFESGNLSAWTSSSGLTVQSALTHTGTFAAQANTTTGATYAKKTLPSTYMDGYSRVFFNLQSTSSQVNLLRHRTAADVSIAYLFVNSSGALGIHNDTTGTSLTSSTVVAPGSGWHELELHTLINGASSVVEVWLDGVKVAALSSTTNLGTAAVGRVQIGDSQTGRTYNVVYDDVAFGTQRVGP
jgi:hypothetical protein